MTRFPYLVIICGALFFSVGALRCLAGPHSVVSSVLDGTRSRQNEVLHKQLASPYPPTGMWHYEDFALAAYWLNRKTAAADAGLVKCKTDFRDRVRAGSEKAVAGDFHWHAYLLERIYFLFSSRGKYFPGRMGAAAEKAVLDMLWEWAAPNCRKEMTRPERVWWVWGSENHHIQAWVSFWGAAQIFKDHPDYRNRTYADGTPPAAMAKAFDEYFKLFARERAAKGLLVEVASPTYAKYTLNTWYNLADFAEDPVLKKRMNMLLDLYWADWAIEQIDGVRGGSRHRCYPGRASIQGSGGDGMSWFFFGLGTARSTHPGHICAATTFWRPSPVVVELALDTPGRGEYAYVSRRPGLKRKRPEKAPPMNFVQDARNLFYSPRGVYAVAPEGGGLLRYTWCTPDFVMGMSEVEARPWDDWTAISSQNRWNGVIFGGHPTARIFTQPLQPKRGSVYNAEWGVQKKGVMILQRLRTSHHAHGQRIWFDKSLVRVERDGWVFAEAPRAYAAVRIVHGGGAWQADSVAQHREKKGPTDLGEWLALNDEYSPVIIEVARKKDVSDFRVFQTAVLANSLTNAHKRLDYRSAFYKTTLTLFTDAGHPPLVDGRPIDFTPAQVYDSPFLNSGFGSGIVTVRKDGQELTLDFNRE